jgi:hypothetical protein
VISLILVILALLIPYIYTTFSSPTHASFTSSLTSYLTLPTASAPHSVSSLHTALSSLAAYKSYQRRLLTRKENAYHKLGRSQRKLGEAIGYGRKIGDARRAVEGNDRVVREMLEIGRREVEGGRAWREGKTKEVEHGRVVEVLKQSVLLLLSLCHGSLAREWSLMVVELDGRLMYVLDWK